MKKWVLYLCLFWLSVFLFGCASPTPSVETESSSDSEDASGEVVSVWKPLSIVTTTPPLYAHVANLIDANDTIINLVPPGSSVHFRQPKPSDVLAMEQADLIVINGLWLEEFLEDYLDSLEAQWIQIVDTSVWVDVLEYEEDNHEEDEQGEDEHDDDDGHGHEWSDPHIWLDTENADAQVWNIVDGLVVVDPDQNDFYNEKAREYTKRIIETDTEIRQLFSGADIAPFVVFHDAYQYFLQSYGLTDKQVWLVQEFHGDNPSQQEIAALIDTIASEDVAVIFTEPQFSPSVVEALEEETGVRAREVDPLWSDLSREAYIEMMKALAVSFSQQAVDE